MFGPLLRELANSMRGGGFKAKSNLRPRDKKETRRERERRERVRESACGLVAREKYGVV